VPWTPKFEAVQEEGLVANILTIITRDFKDALDYFYPIEAALAETDPRYLRDFQERELGQIVGNAFPSLSIGPNRGTSADGPNDECLRQDHSIDIHIGVVDDSPQTVTTRIMRYRGTLDMVLRSAPISDYFVNMSVEVFGFVLDEIDYFYGPIGQRQSANFRGAVLQIPIKINER
jgi:hypothetical protein